MELNWQNYCNSTIVVQDACQGRLLPKLKTKYNYIWRGGGNFEDQWEGAQYLSDDCHFYAVQYVFNLIKHIFSYGFLSFSEKKFSLATLKLLKCYSAAML